MDKRKISEEVYEQYVDASVALFMEYYAASCLDGAVEPGINESEFPAELDTRCRTLINREFARQRRKAFLKSVGKGLGVVACVAAIVLSLSSVLFMTVEAVRVPIINYYIEQSGEYWEISGEQENSSAEFSQGTINITDPLDGLLPTKYVLSTVEGTSLDWLCAVYRSNDNKAIYFTACDSKTMIQIDSENALYSSELLIDGNSAVIVEKDGVVRLAWIHESLGIAFTLSSDELSQEETIAIAKHIIEELQ